MSPCCVRLFPPGSQFLTSMLGGSNTPGRPMTLDIYNATNTVIRNLYFFQAQFWTMIGKVSPFILHWHTLRSWQLPSVICFLTDIHLLRVLVEMSKNITIKNIEVYAENTELVFPSNPFISVLTWLFLLVLCALILSIELAMNCSRPLSHLSTLMGPTGSKTWTGRPPPISHPLSLSLTLLGLNHL